MLRGSADRLVVENPADAAVSKTSATVMQYQLNIFDCARYGNLFRNGHEVIGEFAQPLHRWASKSILPMPRWADWFTETFLNYWCQLVSIFGLLLRRSKCYPRRQPISIEPFDKR